MNDTLTTHDVVIANVSGAVLSGTARSFPRVAGGTNEWRRRSTHVSSLSPTDIVVAHQPATAKSPKQRSLFKSEQTLTRVDASSNPIGTDVFSISTQITRPMGVSLAEFTALLVLHLGALQENSGALATSLYNGEY